MRSPNDPGDVRKHRCAGCGSQIIRGKLCHDCQQRVYDHIADKTGDDDD